MSLVQIFGQINPPPGIESTAGYGDLQSGGLIKFLSNLLKLITIAGGVFSLVNLVLAGMDYIAAQGEPKKTANAWNKIYMTLIGLVIIASSFVLAAILGYIFFGSPRAILSPKIYGPHDINTGSVPPWAQ